MPSRIFQTGRKVRRETPSSFRDVFQGTDPSRLTVPEVLEMAGTDPQKGLSPKEAASRRQARSEEPLFRTHGKRYADCLKQMIREPGLWLLVVVSVVALFFDRAALALTCLILSGGYTALCAWFLFKREQQDAALQNYDQPLSRVVRSGRIGRVGADDVVMGDILLLREGDIVPADCRLLSTDRFSVSGRELDGDRKSRRVVRLAKDADALPDVSTLRLSPENMAFAGDVVETGCARAVVTATGRSTHLGGLLGELRPAHTNRTPHFLKQVRKYLSFWNLLSVGLIIPLTVIGYFTLGDRFDFLDIFLTSLSPAVLSMVAHLLSLAQYPDFFARASACGDRDRNSTADIKTAPDAETLSAMTDLLLIGSAALHDGDPHPESILVGEETFRCEKDEADEAARRATGLLYLFHHALSCLGGARESDCFLSSAMPARTARAFADWAETDTEALLLRVAAVRVSGSVVTVTEQTGAVRQICLTGRFAEFQTCAHMRKGESVCPMEEACLRKFYRAWRQAVRTGSRACFLISEENGERIGEALFTYAPASCRKTSGCIRQMESVGIRTVAFSRTVSDENTRFFASCGLTDTSPAARPSPDGDGQKDESGSVSPADDIRPGGTLPDNSPTRRPAADLVREGVRAFEGCTTEYILSYLRTLQSEGHVVGVLSGDKTDLTLLGAADVAFTCAPSMYDSARKGIPRLSPDDPALSDAPDGTSACTGEDGTEDGACASDLSRRAASVIVRRSTHDGGGVIGVRRALTAADAFRESLFRSGRFLLLSHFLRLLTVMVSLCFGLTLTASPALFLSGLCVDTLMVLLYAHMPVRSAPDAPAPLGDGLLVPWKTFRPECIATVASVFVSWLSVGIGRILTVDFGGDMSYYAFLCLIGSQFALFFTDHLPRRNRMVFFAFLSFVLLFTGGLAAALGAGVNWVFCLLVPLLSPVVFFVTFHVSRLLIRLLSGRMSSPHRGKKTRSGTK